MKSFKPVCLLLILTLFSTCSFGQIWKQYADSAKMFREQNKMDEAIEFYIKSKGSLKKDSSGTISYAASCDSLANLYYEMGQYGEAEPLLLEAKQIKEKVLGKQHPNYATSCDNLAALYYEMVQYEKAEPLYLEAKQIREKVLGKDHPDYATTCNNLAALYRNMGQYEKAEPLYLEAKQIREKVLGKDHPNYANSCHNLAVLYQNIGQYEKAEPLLMEAKQIREKVLGKDHPDYATTCNSLAVLYQNMGQYEKAELLFLEAKQIREKVLGKDHPSYATSCGALAFLYQNMGQYEKAEPLFLEAKQIREKALGKDHPDYANSCNDLATFYLDMGQYEKAEPLYMEDKQICEKVLGKDHPDYATTCDNLATLYFEIGQYEKAEPLLMEAKQIREKVLGKDHPSYGTSCNNLASLYLEIGQYEKAEPLYMEDKQICEKVLGKDHPDYATTCHNLAVLYQNMGQYEKAEPLFLEAKQIREKALGKDHPDYATTCNNLAALYRDMGQYGKAEPLFLEAKQIREKVLGKDHPDYANSCNNLATLYFEIGQYEKAEPLLMEAKQIREKVLGKQHPDYGFSCNKLANLYGLTHRPLLAKKEYEDAFAASSYNVFNVFRFTNEKEKAAYINNISGDDESALSFYISGRIKSGLPYTLSLFHRNLILSASQNLKKQLFSSGDNTISNKYNKWVQLKKDLAIQYSKPVAERKGNVTQMEEKAGSLEKELTRLSSTFAKQQQRVDWKDIQASLQPGEASIEFASFHWNNGKASTDTVLYVALVLRKDSLLPAMIPLFNEQQLRDVLPAAGNKTTNVDVKKLYTLGGTDKDSKLAGNQSAYELIWKPLEKELTGINTIYFAPSGLLHRIAFAALPVTNTEVLSDRYKLVQLATTASVADQQPSFLTASDKIRLYGGIKYNVDTTLLKKEVIAYHDTRIVNRSLPDDVERSAGWDELPGTKKELAGIVALSNAYKSNITSYSGIYATEESVKALNGKASPGVIHIATHGFFFPDPKEAKKQEGNVESGQVFKLTDDPLMRSGLLFAGANSAWQNKPVEGIDDGILTAYEVANLYLPNTKLVVLSACETGLGDIQGNEGVYGLQRAFKMAGAQNLVMSLWKVPDAETVEFMQAFYKNLFARRSISDAFYRAQKLMKDRYRQQPEKWAAWVLVQ